MGLFDHLKGLFARGKSESQSAAPSPAPAPGATDYAARRDRLLAAFPHRLLPASLSRDEIVAEWERAQDQPGTPVLLLFEDYLVDMLEENEWPGDDLPDLDALFAGDIDTLTHDEGAKPLIGACGEKPGPLVKPLRSLDYAEPAPLYLAQIPVEQPWEIFKHLPFGGGNIMYEAPVFAAFCKEMNEKYGARPLLLSATTLEMKVARRPATPEEAYDLALRMYGLSDSLTQEYGTIWMLADSLLKSDYWFFWWD